MIKRRCNGSILSLLLSDGEGTPERWNEGEDNDIGKYLVYACCSFSVNGENNENINRSNYLLVIKNNCTMNFYTVHSYRGLSQSEPTYYECIESEPRYYECANEGDPIVVDSDKQKEDAVWFGGGCKLVDGEAFGKEEGDRVEFKDNTLNLKSLSIAKKPWRRIHKNDLVLIMEAPVKADGCAFSFCALLETGNRLTLFYYDPTELEYLDENETITLDNISIRDIFPSVVSVYSEVMLGSFSEVYHFMSVSLRKSRCKLKGFDETENTFEIAVNNYKRVNSIYQEVNYEGLCINKFYLDQKIVDSFSSFSYLDDSIIDFFNQLTTKYIMDSSQRETWIILSTYFLRKIKQYPDQKEAYDATWKWTRKFKRPLPLNHFIFIPINLSDVHWSLVIIANPKYAIRYAQVKSEKKASIIHLDSLGHHQLDSNICETLKNYLYEEFESRCKSLKEKGFRFYLEQSCWEVVTPTRGIPLQNNGYDCGIYVIEYIIHLVLNQNIFGQLVPRYERSGFRRGELSRHTKWFTQAQVHQRRLNMKQVLRFMRDNPKWSSDQDKVKYVTDKMTKQY